MNVSNPRVWAAAACDAYVGLSNEVKDLADRTKGSQDRTGSAAERQRAYFLGFFPEYVKLLRATTEEIVAIGPPDVTGGPEWHAEIVDNWESSFDDFDAITEQLIDDLEKLPMTPASSGNERELVDRYGELLQDLNAKSGYSTVPRSLGR